MFTTTSLSMIVSEPDAISVRMKLTESVAVCVGVALSVCNVTVISAESLDFRI